MFHRLALVSLIVASIQSLKLEMQLERFEQVSGFDLVNTTGIRVKKFNRSTWIMDGEGEAFRDFGDEFSFTITAAYSRLGNNQFNEYPMKIQRRTMCQMLNGQYKEYQDYFLNWTNLPRVGDEWFCPFPKGKYWVRQYAPNAGWIPPVVPEGYWRLTTDVFGPDGEIAVKYLTFVRLIHHLV